MFAQNWDETGEGGELAIDFSALSHLYQQGALLPALALTGTTPTGYALALVARHPFTSAHYALVAAFYVDPDYRGTTTAARLMRDIEQQAKAAGVDSVVWQVRYGSGIDAALRKRGYIPADVNLTKRINTNGNRT